MKSKEGLFHNKKLPRKRFIKRSLHSLHSCCFWQKETLDIGDRGNLYPPTANSNSNGRDILMNFSLLFVCRSIGERVTNYHVEKIWPTTFSARHRLDCGRWVDRSEIMRHVAVSPLSDPSFGTSWTKLRLFSNLCLRKILMHCCLNV